MSGKDLMKKYPYIGKYPGYSLPQPDELIDLIVFFTTPSEGYCLYSDSRYNDKYEGKFRKDWVEESFKEYENL